MMKKLLKSLPTGLPSALAILLVAYLSLDPDPLGETGLTLFAGADKVAHFLMYFATTCVFVFDYAKFKMPHHTKVNMELLFTCCAMLLGLLMEVGQLVLSNGRSYDAFDIVANCLGATAALAYLHWRGIKKFRRLMRSGHHHHHRH